jgi:hypothetical protein
VVIRPWLVLRVSISFVLKFGALLKAKEEKFSSRARRAT